MNSKAEHCKQWIQPHLLIQFSSEAYERMAYIKNEETYSKKRENTIKNRTPQESQQVPQNL